MGKLLKEEYNDILNILQQRYPKLFSKEPICLFKIGLFKELAAVKDLGINKNKLRQFFRYHSNKKEYKRLHQTLNSNRYDLNGEVVGVITQEDIDWYKEQYTKIKKKTQPQPGNTKDSAGGNNKKRPILKLNFNK